jgi:hypothetical protein
MRAKPPAAVEARFADLSPDLQSELRAIAARDDDGARVDRPAALWPLAALLLGAAAVAWIGVLVVRGDGEAYGWRSCAAWDEATRGGAILLSSLAGALLAAGAGAIVRRRRAELGSFWTIARGYLADVRYQRVRLIPLRALHVEPDAPEQAMRVAFGKKRFEIDLRARGGRAFAKALGRAIEEAHAETRDVAAGYREDVRHARKPDADPSSRPSPEPAARHAAATVAAALIGAAAGIWVLPHARVWRGHQCLATECIDRRVRPACEAYAARFPAGGSRDAVDDAYFRISRARLPDLDAYAAAFPEGRHRDEAVAARREIFREALAKLPDANRPPLLQGALDALAGTRAGGQEGSTIYLRFTHQIERRRLTREEITRLEERSRGDGPALETLLSLVAARNEQDPLEILFPEEKMSPPSASAFPDDAARTHEEQVATELTRSLGAAVGSLGLRFVRVEADRLPSDAVVVLDVRYTVKQQRGLLGMTNEPGEARAERLAGRISYWEMGFHFRVSGARPSALAGAAPLEIDVPAPRNLDCITRDNVYLEQRNVGFRRLAERIEAGFGLKVEPYRTCAKADETAR